MSSLRTREVIVAASTAALGLGAVVALGWADWPGTPFDCSANPCYCEQPVSGLVRQIGNTWSNLGAVVAGLAVAVLAAKRRLARARPHEMIDLFGLLAPPALVFQGVGSMFFHGGLTVWGSALDAMSMFAIAGLLVLTQFVRLEWLRPQSVVKVWLGLLTAGLLAGFESPPLVAGLVFVLFLAILATEVRLSSLGRSARGTLFRVGLAVHVASVAVWFFSAGEGLPLCRPDSMWQGHGLWHLGAAGAVTLMVLHLLENLEVRAR
jgi:hypothetical protein